MIAFQQNLRLAGKKFFLESGICYLEGTQQTVDELLSSQWELQSCARCQIPIPMKNSVVITSPCTCIDLENWPNNELPMPHLPINHQQSLRQIAERPNLRPIN